MKNSKIFILIHVTILFFTTNFFGQNFELSITSNEKNEKSVLNNIDYQKNHKNKSSIKLETQKITKHLKTIGYFTNKIDSTVFKNKKVIIFFNLGKKIDYAVINISNIDKLLIKGFKITNDSIKLPIKELDFFLRKISQQLGNEGKSFSEVHLVETRVYKNYILASLNIKESEKRKIQKIIIKGYEDFPRSFIRNYYKIDKDAIFNQKRINRIYELTNQLDFIEQLKKPEVLFKPDSTHIYLYLRKKTNNSIDALLNFGSKENGKLFFNGNLNLELNNILNYGEGFKLIWNKIDENRQELNLSTKIPYFLKSTISPEINFSLYRQDSSFVSTKLRSLIRYKLNSRNNLSISYDIETSNNNSSTNTEIESYKNYFFGIGYEFQKKIKAKSKIDFNISTEFGVRETVSKTKQQKITSNISYTYTLNNRNHFYLENNTGYLNSKNLLLNELFRIGGVNTIRGFNEQSIFTDKYSYFNIEYRYKTNTASYLYTITDIGIYKHNLQHNSILGLGLGYLYETKRYQINLGLATGKMNKEKINFQNAKLLLSWKNYF
ncbi:MAG: ShlB/FhaC/HecB family hemolysin secretion/activation protein [Polaribacter sp.]